MNKIVIEYQTHHVLANKNSLTEMNRQLRKIETPQNQTTHNHTNINKTRPSKMMKENFLKELMENAQRQINKRM